LQPPMCGVVSNWAAAFSPTDDECREAWDNTTVTCPPVNPIEVCRNCAVGAVESPSGSCHDYYSTTCLQSANCSLCYNSIKANPALPSLVCFFDPTACALMACIYNGECHGPPGQGGPCNSPDQVTVTCPPATQPPVPPTTTGAADLSFFVGAAATSCKNMQHQYVATIYNDNNNGVGAGNVQFHLRASPFVVLGTVSSSAGSCTKSGQNVSCSLGNLGVHPASLGVTINYVVDPSTPSGTLLSGFATVSANQVVNVQNDVFQISQTAANCQSRRSTYFPPAAPAPTAVIVTEAARKSFVPREHKGKVLAAKLLSVQLKKGEEARTFKMAMKNTMRLTVELEDLSVQVTVASGKVQTADLSKVGGIVAKTTCARILGSKLHSNWESLCEFELADAGVSVQVSARGTQTVRSGFHPVMGSATLA